MERVIISLIVYLSIFSTDEVVGSRIIMSAPQFPSHVNVQVTVASELVKRGHEVYMAIGSRISDPKKLTRFGIMLLHYRIPDDVVFGLTADYENAISEATFSGGSPEYTSSVIATRDCSLMMQDESFKRKAKELRFDLGIFEPFIYAPCHLILGRFLEIPFVSLSTLLAPWELRIPALPTFYSILGSYPVVDGSTIFGRITNLVAFIVAETSMFIPGPHNTTLLQQYAPELHSWKELVRKSELILTDIDHHMGVPLPAFPYLVTVPGISIFPTMPLDPHLDALFNENENGVIVMSLGSLVRHFPSDIIRKFFGAFSRLRQTVIARMAPPTDGTEIPTNVKLFHWLPQNDLLGHANTRLFITHCGNSGQYEMLYHGIPFVGFPMFGDQGMNCKLAFERGYGIKLNILTFTSEELFQAIEEVLNNENYTKAIKRASEIFRDQPLIGRQKAVHWIEHVIKYGGSHLRSKALDLPFYQFLMLDVLGVLVIFSLIMLWLIKYLMGVAIRKIWHKKSEVTRNAIVPEIKYGKKINKIE